MAVTASEPGPPVKISPPPAGRQWWRPILLLGLIVVVLVLAFIFHVGQKLSTLMAWVMALGPAGPVVFILLYAAAVVAALPASTLSLTAGALFGGIKAVILVRYRRHPGGRPRLPHRPVFRPASGGPVVGRQ